MRQLFLKETLLAHGMLYGMSRESLRGKMEETLRFAELTDVAGRGVSTYSGGMKRRLSIKMRSANKRNAYIRYTIYYYATYRKMY
jgi:ABC-type multidrug transport system ATPase subunit